MLKSVEHDDFFFSKSVLEILIENIDTREAVTGAIIRTSSNISRQQHFSITNKGNNLFLLLTIPKKQLFLYMYIRCLFPFLDLVFVFIINHT